MTAWYVLLALWVGWWISWMIAARWASTATASAPATSELSYRALTVAGVALIFLPLQMLSPAFTLYAPSEAITWLAVLLAAAGFAFCWWARVTLGTLWSSNVTRKEDHRVVDTGPYALVRHPIYTGVILAAFATALAKGTVLGFAGVAIFALSFYVKGRLEEQFLRKELGTEAYDAYRARVPMLIPFWPFG
jgi:protein-S-isoprenylcysteine O-methyltransferase Ste14